MNASSRRLRAEDVAWFAAFVVAYWFAYRFGMSFGHQSPSPFWIPDSLRSPPLSVVEGGVMVSP